MRTLIERLCSPECAGRRPGTKEGNAARAIVLQALRDAGLDPYEQRVEGCGGANVLAKVRGDVERYVLVGHRFGPEGVPDEVGQSLFALGAERSLGTYQLVSSLKRAETGVIVRTADAEIIPPLSDYQAFWEQRIPFLFLTAGRSRVYHTPDDTPDKPKK